MDNNTAKQELCILTTNLPDEHTSGAYILQVFDSAGKLIACDPTSLQGEIQWRTEHIERLEKEKEQLTNKNGMLESEVRKAKMTQGLLARDGLTALEYAMHFVPLPMIKNTKASKTARELYQKMTDAINAFKAYQHQ